MHYIGIDCGLDGAIAIVSGNNIHAMIEMPTINNDGKREIDIHRLSNLFDNDNIRNSHIAYVENPGHHAPSASGLRSMTYSYAIIKTLLIANGIENHSVMARTWQREFWEKPKDSKIKYDTKASALSVANRIWSKTDWRRTPRSKKCFDGYVDAALIAEYGRRRDSKR
jgi:hypothetical protein